MTTLSERYFNLKKQVGPACLIAVSKLQSIEDIVELYQLGQRDFGENYVQEMVEKAQTLKDRGVKDIRWHFIGPLQKNKINALLPWIHTLHTVDSLKLAEAICQRWKRAQPLPIFVQINIDKEESKSGLAPDLSLLDELLRNLKVLKQIHVQGLMCIPRPGQGSLPYERLSALAQQSKEMEKVQLSMGMSDDYLVALRYGASHVRVGSALFGPRKADSDKSLKKR